MDYNEFSEKIKAKYPQYKDMDNKELAQKMVAKYPQYSDITFDNVEQPKENKGIDLTPSGIGRTMATATVAPFYASKTGQKVSDAYGELKGKLAQKPKTGLEKTLDVASTFALPQAKILQAGKLAPLVNNLVTGAYQGGLIGGVQGLQEGKGLEGTAGGAGIGATLTAGLPLVGKVAQKGLELLPQTGGLFAKTLGRIQPETLKRAVQPDSVALDLTKDEAQNLLMNTAEGIQKQYAQLLDRAGKNVRNAAENLIDERAVYADALQNTLDDIYNNYSVSGNENINSARRVAGDIYSETSELINKAKNPNNKDKISASALYDIMENVKEFPIDFNKTSASKKQGIMKQIYNEYSRKLANLSPELRKANQEYAKLAKFDDNEGVRKIIRPDAIKQENIDTASSALRNYNSTVTKGNTNRNIQDLEKILVDAGNEPFLNKIDDVNAAMDLLNARTTGDSWLANLATQMTRPVLKATRGLNRAVQRNQVPQKLQAFNEKIGDWQRFITPGLYGAPTMMLQGGLQYNDYR